MMEKTTDLGSGLYAPWRMALRPPIIRLVTDDQITHAASGASFYGTSTVQGLSGGTNNGSGGAVTLSGTLAGSTLSVGTYANAAAIGATGLTVNITGGSSYNYGSSGRFKVTFSGGGATTQATGYVNTTAGVIVSLTIQTTGAGYTSAPTISLPVNSTTNIYIDLGPNYDQYGTASISFTPTAGLNFCDWFTAYSSADGATYAEMLLYAVGSTNGEAYVVGIATSGSPGRIITLGGTRYVRLTFHAALDSLVTSRLQFSAYPT